MAKKHKSKHYKSGKKQQRKIDKMQATFVDANVFLDTLLDETSRSLMFFSSFKGRTRMVITSTHAIGEVVRRVYRMAQEESGRAGSGYKIEKTIEAFKELLDETNMQIENFSDGTYNQVRRIMEEDGRLKFKDALHIALAHEFKCNKFCTLDRGIDETTLKKFGMTYADI